jgi:hypothetical protein
MSYQTGSSSGITDLISLIAAFAITDGWTVGSSWTSGAYTLLPFTKFGAYVLFQYNSTEIHLNTATSISGTGLATAQTNAASASKRIYPVTGPYSTYDLFGDGFSIHCAIQIASGVFTHINFGSVEKNGSWTGGMYVTGSSSQFTSPPSTANLAIDSGSVDFPFMTSDVGSHNPSLPTTSHMRSSLVGANKIAAFGRSDLVGNTDCVFTLPWATSSGRRLIDASPNTYNGRAIILPITIVQASSGITAPYYQMGCVKNAGVTNIRDFNPRDVVNTDWMVFPIGNKGSSSGTYIGSKNYGMAYKK